MTTETRRAQKAMAMRRYRARHPERVRASDRAAQRRAVQKRTPEAKLAAKAADAARYMANAEGRRAARRAYYAANKGRWAVYNGKRKAAERGLAIEPVSRLVVLELNDGVCGICGLDVDPARFHLDHILPLSVGGWHGYDNVQVAHPLCNLRKRAS